MSASAEEGIRILAVDDEVRGMELLQLTLRRFGSVDGATSGQQAWDMFQTTKYQLVLSDQRMPGMQGVELLTRVAESQPHCGRMLVTGYADLDDPAIEWERRVSDAVVQDDDVQEYVRRLEEESDRTTEAELPSGDDLAAEFQRFLRDQPGDDR